MLGAQQKTPSHSLGVFQYSRSLRFSSINTRNKPFPFNAPRKRLSRSANCLSLGLFRVFTRVPVVLS
jgi:hypothetical protein